MDAILTSLAAVSALCAGCLHSGVLKSRSSLLVLTVLSVLEGGAILLCCRTTNLYVSYGGFILFGALYAFTITIASAEVAKHLEEDSYGLVFGINTLIALILQSVLTIVVVSDGGFALTIINQYTVYAFYFIFVGLLYLLYYIIVSIRSCTKSTIEEITTLPNMDIK